MRGIYAKLKFKEVRDLLHALHKRLLIRKLPKVHIPKYDELHRQSEWFYTGEGIYKRREHPFTDEQLQNGRDSRKSW